jgi:putative ABC transport system permease protein
MSRPYRVLVRIYPRWFREQYGAELLNAFAADRKRYDGRFGSIAFWMFIVSDLAISAYRIRCAPATSPKSLNPIPRRSLMEALAQDLRHAFRQLVRRPGFTAIAVLSLALGIGGNAIIFAFFDGFVLHPFAYPDPDRVVTIGSTFPRMSSEERFIEAISAPEIADIQNAKSIRSFAVFDLGNRNISGGDRPERVMTALAVTDLFEPFGLRPALGRGFTTEELASGTGAGIISYRLWQGRFGGDPHVIGSAVKVNGVPTTVVGVMPPELLLLGTDLWLPRAIDPQEYPRNRRHNRCARSRV